MTETTAKPPVRFEIVGDGEPTDEAISLLATILLEITDESALTVSIPPVECNEPYDAHYAIGL